MLARPAAHRGIMSEEEDMNGTRRNQWMALVGAMLSVLLLVPTVSAQQTAKKEHAFRGKVEKVDAKTKTVTVAGENVEGWMPAMTMIYKVDKEDVLKQVKAGDQITAKVYDGDFQVLHDVKIVPAPPKNPKT
jgi:Cu/Ag efflux protein CusF